MKIEISRLSTEFNGERCYVHARGALRDDGFGIITMQKLELSGSDLFYGIEFITTADSGASFTDPKLSRGLERKYFSDGTSEVMCDATPFYHKSSGKILLIGHMATYNGDKGIMKPKTTAYSIYDEASGDFTPVQMIRLPESLRGRYYVAGSGCSQISETDSGDLLIPFYFSLKDGGVHFSSAVMHCRFDGKSLECLEIGNDVTVEAPRGLCEPSIVQFKGESYLSLRNDVSGYVARVRDGIRIDMPIELCFDDGENLGNYNTQQHWLVGDGKLWLVYTRRAENNSHVFRHRAPLFMAEFDPTAMRVIRDTETVVVPERGARLGNFGCQSYSDEIGYVFASEWMQGNHGVDGCRKYGSDNSIFISKVIF